MVATPTLFDHLSSTGVFSGLLPRHAIMWPESKPERRAFHEVNTTLDGTRDDLVQWPRSAHSWASREQRTARFSADALSMLDGCAASVQRTCGGEDESAKLMLQRLIPAAYKLAMLSAAGRMESTQGHTLTSRQVISLVLKFIAHLVSPSIAARICDTATRAVFGLRSVLGGFGRHRTEQARLVEAIAGGSEIAVLTKALRAREQRRAYLQHELDNVDADEHPTAFDVSATARELGRRVEEWHGLVQRNTPVARQVLDQLLTDRICWTPRRDEGIYEYSGRLHYDRLLAGIVNTEKRGRAKSAIVTEGMASPSRRAPFRNVTLSVGMDFFGALKVV